MPGASGALTRTITGSSESLNTTIDSIQLPFENELKKYVVANEENIGALISDMSSMLTDLKDLNIAMMTMLLDPTDYDDAYTSSILTQLNTSVLANLNNASTGLPTATEQAMFDRRRNRKLFESSRTSRRTTVDISKRLPYAGMMADKLTEADQDTINAMDDVENWITEQQGLMTYKFQREKIAESIRNEQLNMGDLHTRKARELQAYSTYDEINVRNHWNNFEVQIKQILGHVQVGIDFALKAAGGADQITFTNWRTMSAMMAEGQLRIAALVSTLMPGGSLT